MPYVKVCLGHNVYAEYCNGDIRLTTENGLPNDPSNKIMIDGEILEALNKFVDMFIKEQ